MVKVEFFGIPRERTGIPDTTVEATTIGNLLDLLAQQYPDFRDSCMVGEQLTKDVLFSVNGRTITRDRDYPLQEEDSVLILTSDIGG